MGTREDNQSSICHSQSPPRLEDLKGPAELPLQSKEVADSTAPKQNEDAQSGTNDCNIEKTGVDLSSSGPEPMNEYMLVDDFIFSDRSLVGRFTLMNPTAQDLSQWSGKHWRPKLRSNWMFKIMGAGFFKIELFSEEDCEFVLENGPWFMGVAGLSLKRWSPDFDPQNPGALKTPIWVRLLHLPLPVLWSEEVLVEICSVIGKLLKISEPYMKGNVVSMTCRICVEVDLSERLTSEIIVKVGDQYAQALKLDYEGIPFRCRVCHSTKHQEGACPEVPRGTR